MRLTVLLAAALLSACAGIAPRAPVLPLDHVTVGVPDLDRAIADFHAQTGITPHRAGAHPTRGTVNALVSFGDGSYLELLGPDPNGTDTPLRRTLLALRAPTVDSWVVQTGDAEALRTRLTAAGYGMAAIGEGMRKAHDGGTVRWRYTHAEPVIAQAPFFIEWAPGTVHPSKEATPGCALAAFILHSPDADGLQRFLRAAGHSRTRVVSGGGEYRLQVRCGTRGITY